MINSQKIKARIIELGLTQEGVAKRIKMSQSSLNCKINNVRPMTTTDAENLCSVLKISDNDFGDYFFYRGVAKHD
jgi:transcriptional regulator with XRE-family HTH domain